jgi:hypothetical protein
VAVPKFRSFLPKISAFYPISLGNAIEKIDEKIDEQNFLAPIEKGAKCLF